MLRFTHLRSNTTIDLRVFKRTFISSNRTHKEWTGFKPPAQELSVHHLDLPTEQVHRRLKRSYTYKKPVTKVGDGVWQYRNGLKYRVVGATIIERMPKLTPDKQQWELDYEELFFRRRNELARSEGEPILDPAQQAGLGKKMPKDKNERNVDETDYTIDDLALFEPASRITEDDKTNNIKSSNRKLSESLYLLVKKPRHEFAWQFPQGGYEEEKDGLHLLNTAKREAKEELGDNLSLWYYGNAPLFHYIYTFPPDSPARKLYKCDGTKVFFYTALYMEGDVKLDANELEDYGWFPKSDLIQQLGDTPLSMLCNKILS